jgi:hypothetical protein
MEIRLDNLRGLEIGALRRSPENTA